MTCLRLLLAAAVAAFSSTAALAQAGDTGTTAWRCGNSYSTTPCPGGTAVDVGDPRSDAQRRQAETVKAQDARLAQSLAVERQAREKAAAGQRPASLGPTEADRAKAQAAADRLQAQQRAKELAKERQARKKTKHPPRA